MCIRDRYISGNNAAAETIWRPAGTIEPISWSPSDFVNKANTWYQSNNINHKIDVHSYQPLYEPTFSRPTEIARDYFRNLPSSRGIQFPYTTTGSDLLSAFDIKPITNGRFSISGYYPSSSSMGGISEGLWKTRTLGIDGKEISQTITNGFAWSPKVAKLDIEVNNNIVTLDLAKKGGLVTLPEFDTGVFEEFSKAEPVIPFKTGYAVNLSEARIDNGQILGQGRGSTYANLPSRVINESKIETVGEDITGSIFSEVAFTNDSLDNFSSFRGQLRRQIDDVPLSAIREYTQKSLDLDADTLSRIATEIEVPVSANDIGATLMPSGIMSVSAEPIKVFTPEDSLVYADSPFLNPPEGSNLSPKVTGEGVDLQGISSIARDSRTNLLIGKAGFLLTPRGRTNEGRIIFGADASPNFSEGAIWRKIGRYDVESVTRTIRGGERVSFDKYHGIQITPSLSIGSLEDLASAKILGDINNPLGFAEQLSGKAGVVLTESGRLQSSPHIVSQFDSQRVFNMLTPEQISQIKTPADWGRYMVDEFRYGSFEGSFARPYSNTTNTELGFVDDVILSFGKNLSGKEVESVFHLEQSHYLANSQGVNEELRNIITTFDIPESPIVQQIQDAQIKLDSHGRIITAVPSIFQTHNRILNGTSSNAFDESNLSETADASSRLMQEPLANLDFPGLSTRYDVQLNDKGFVDIGPFAKTDVIQLAITKSGINPLHFAPNAEGLLTDFTKEIPVSLAEGIDIYPVGGVDSTRIGYKINEQGSFLLDLPTDVDNIAKTVGAAYYEGVKLDIGNTVIENLSRGEEELQLIQLTQGIAEFEERVDFLHNLSRVPNTDTVIDVLDVAEVGSKPFSGSELPIKLTGDVLQFRREFQKNLTNEDRTLNVSELQSIKPSEIAAFENLGVKWDEQNHLMFTSIRALDDAAIPLQPPSRIPLDKPGSDSIGLKPLADDSLVENIQILSGGPIGTNAIGTSFYDAQESSILRMTLDATSLNSFKAQIPLQGMLPYSRISLLEDVNVVNTEIVPEGRNLGFASLEWTMDKGGWEVHENSQIAYLPNTSISQNFIDVDARNKQDTFRLVADQFSYDVDYTKYNGGIQYSNSNFIGDFGVYTKWPTETWEQRNRSHELGNVWAHMSGDKGSKPGPVLEFNFNKKFNAWTYNSGDKPVKFIFDTMGKTNAIDTQTGVIGLAVSANLETSRVSMLNYPTKDRQGSFHLDFGIPEAVNNKSEESIDLDGPNSSITFLDIHSVSKDNWSLADATGTLDIGLSLKPEGVAMAPRYKGARFSKPEVDLDELRESLDAKIHLAGFVPKLDIEGVFPGLDEETVLFQPMALQDRFVQNSGQVLNFFGRKILDGQWQMDSNSRVIMQHGAREILTYKTKALSDSQYSTDKRIQVENKTPPLEMSILAQWRFKNLGSDDTAPRFLPGNYAALDITTGRMAFMTSNATLDGKAIPDSMARVAYIDDNNNPVFENKPLREIILGVRVDDNGLPALMTSGKAFGLVPDEVTFLRGVGDV